MATPVTKEESDVLIVDELEIHTSSHEIFVRGQKVSLTPTEFGIVEVLARHKGSVLSMRQLYELVWNQTFYEAENTIMVHIRKVREKIEENPKEPRYIKTVWGVGYKMNV
jgi:DNA-binding response OmpR family regulator